MPRRQFVSAKQKKAELQLKRAIKRAEVSPSNLSENQAPAKQRQVGSTSKKTPAERKSQGLESSFPKVDPGFLEATRSLASVTPLPRPLPVNVTTLAKSDIVYGSDGNSLFCPKRPKWRFEMTKKEVEANEEVLFRKWLTETDDRISRWMTLSGLWTSHSEGTYNAPVYYERNLEVWRQLWRVTEISNILLVLLDSRCPALHFPPSLHHFLSNLTPSRPLIFVLTKTDMVPEPYISAWTTWLETKYPNAQIAQVHNYRLTGAPATDETTRRKIKHELGLRDVDFLRLVSAIQKSCDKLIAPPEGIRHDIRKVEDWRNTRDFPTLMRWDDVLSRKPYRECRTDEKYITIGLIGQPNVGKSSLLNALFETHKVKASRTPGKTKHLQTLFWTPQIRLVDCPGIVFPQFVRMELQVLGGILPISQIPSIPACMLYVLQLLPLERILELKNPSELEEASDPSLNIDKRTWRDTKVLPQRHHVFQWTAMEVLSAFAIQKSWVTAKAGRPDINRAGNYILRSLAEGRIKWAFWPPETKATSMSHDTGIWLSSMVGDEEETWDDISSSSGSEEPDVIRTISDQEPNGSAEEGESEVLTTFSRFKVLALEDTQIESIGYS